MPRQLLCAAGHQVVLAAGQTGAIPAGGPRLLDGVIFGQLRAAPEARAIAGGSGDGIITGGGTRRGS